MAATSFATSKIDFSSEYIKSYDVIDILQWIKWHYRILFFYFDVTLCILFELRLRVKVLIEICWNPEFHVSLGGFISFQSHKTIVYVQKPQSDLCIFQKCKMVYNQLKFVDDWNWICVCQINIFSKIGRFINFISKIIQQRTITMNAVLMVLINVHAQSKYTHTNKNHFNSYALENCLPWYRNQYAMKSQIFTYFSWIFWKKWAQFVNFSISLPIAILTLLNVI